eukprot:TRINITY_DN5585_c0_g1_i4.p1 TRINITY_DN5585_c0_g1~~TRINITY_DN5585_c0_g1_i4.p1  ORF type:complete len:708 (+),score=283.29 TRINITY_DN5585_c0_g1_i4:75-2126(+)
MPVSGLEAKLRKEAAELGIDISKCGDAWDIATKIGQFRKEQKQSNAKQPPPRQLPPPAGGTAAGGGAVVGGPPGAAGAGAGPGAEERSATDEAATERCFAALRLVDAIVSVFATREPTEEADTTRGRVMRLIRPPERYAGTSKADVATPHGRRVAWRGLSLLLHSDRHRGANPSPSQLARLTFGFRVAESCYKDYGQAVLKLDKDLAVAVRDWNDAQERMREAAMAFYGLDDGPDEEPQPPEVFECDDIASSDGGMDEAVGMETAPPPPPPQPEQTAAELAAERRRREQVERQQLELEEQLGEQQTRAEEAAAELLGLRAAQAEAGRLAKELAAARAAEAAQAAAARELRAEAEAVRSERRELLQSHALERGAELRAQQQARDAVDAQAAALTAHAASEVLAERALRVEAEECAGRERAGGREQCDRLLLWARFAAHGTRCRDEDIADLEERLRRYKRRLTEAKAKALASYATVGEQESALRQWAEWEDGAEADQQQELGATASQLRRALRREAASRVAQQLAAEQAARMSAEFREHCDRQELLLLLTADGGRLREQQARQAYGSRLREMDGRLRQLRGNLANEHAKEWVHKEQVLLRAEARAESERAQSRRLRRLCKDAAAAIAWLDDTLERSKAQPLHVRWPHALEFRTRVAEALRLSGEVHAVTPAHLTAFAGSEHYPVH